MSEPMAQQMQALLDDWARAIVSNDPDAIASFARDDWALVGGRGVFEGGQFLELVASGELTHEAMDFEVLRTWEHGDTVVVLAHGTNRGHWRGDPFAEDEYVTEVFAREGAGWRCVVSTLTPREAG